MNGVEQLARQCVSIMLSNQRQLPKGCNGKRCEDCSAPHLEKAMRSIELGEPLQWLLLAFPCKSPSSKKTLGQHADKAEELSLRFLHEAAERVGTVYEPGAQIIIGADGRAFADLVEVSDDVVTAYIKDIQRIIAADALSIQYMGLDELFPEMAARQEYDALRSLLHDEDEIDALRLLAKSDEEALHQANGITRFLMEDLLGVHSDYSRSKAQRLTRPRAYALIQRGDALRAILQERFPLALRLSVHPQATHSSKLGIRIFPGGDTWTTPWHACAVERPDGSFELMRRQEAEAAGAKLVYRDGRPSHFYLV